MELTRIPSTSSVFALLLVFLRCCNVTSEHIAGTRQICDVDGEDVTIDKIPNARCFQCTCRSGFVECQRQHCPIIDGCYALLDPRKDDCCRVCRGCTWNGVNHASGTEWTEVNEPCRIFTCKAGIVTESRLQCYAPCLDRLPIAPGQCCPVCAECSMNGQTVAESRSVTTAEDPCVICRCNLGRLACTKQACPVLHCPAAKILHNSGECCPRCKGSGRFVLPLNDTCTLGTTVYNTGDRFDVDPCTRCTCANSTISCARETCPVLECPSEHQVTLPGRCCPRCSFAVENEAFCSDGGRIYANGESWNLDFCKTCVCLQGRVRCMVSICPSLSPPCPSNSKLTYSQGQCCPRCVENDGVCTVFGDPHYRTFDGKYYRFNGACKYQLVGDCLRGTFSIRIINDASSTKVSAWIKTITMRIGDLKVNISQKMKVRVNGKKVNVPYRVANRLDINRTDDGVVVYTQIGIRLLWDGIGFLEVSALASYKGRLCGLCGNFNSLAKDDFTTRLGELSQDPQHFGQSWNVGTRKACTRLQARRINEEKRCERRRNQRLCKQLQSQIFLPCHEKVNPTMYYNACIHDMCECQTEYCYCESFTAYVYECARLRVQLSQWRKFTKCPTVWERLGNWTNVATY